MSFPQPRTLTGVDRGEQSFLSILDNNKTSEINPPHTHTPSVPFLLCTSAVHQQCCSGGREEGEESIQKGRRDARKAYTERASKERRDGKKGRTKGWSGKNDE